MAAVTAAALAAAVLPAATATAAGGKPVSAWGKGSPDFTMPPVKVGANRPVKSRPAKDPDDSVFLPWLREQRAHAKDPESAASARKSKQAGKASAASVLNLVPEGQGDVPWHRYTSFAITDALTAKIDYSTGNLMLTATDFDIAGVGQRLRLARTYNSLDAPFGRVSQRWWQQYERYLSVSSSEVIFYDASGATVRFKKNSDGSFTTPKGYSQDLKKNSDGTYTLTKWKSGSKETYNASGTLTKVTDRNHGTVTVTQNSSGGFKLTETRSGRWIELTKTNATLWQAKDTTGRTAAYTLDTDGNVSATTDTEGKTTAFGYDTSGRVNKITTAEGRVTVFTYDDTNRVTSMLRATGFNASGSTGPTWTYAYTSDSPTASGTTTATDPELHATTYEHDGDGQVTKVTDALGHNRSTKFDANHNIDTATDAMGSGTTPGNATDYGFNDRNNLETVKAPTGGTTVNHWQTIAGGDVPSDSTNPDGEKTSFTYDTVGNTTSVAQTGTGGGNVSYDYNPATPSCGGFEGQRCKAKTKMTAAKTVTTDFHYDAKGNLDKVTPPAPLDKTTYTYDDLGRTKSVTDARGVTVSYTYDNRDRIRTVTSPNTVKVEYGYDGDGNLVQRTDGTGTVKYQFDPLQRETVRTLQDTSQTLLAYTPAGNVDYYQDPAGKVDYTWNEVNKLKELKDPQGRLTTYDYNKNDTRTTTTYPGGTVQKVDVDNSSRPKNIKVTSAQGTLVNLDYTYGYGTDGKTDGDKIRTSTDNVSGLKRTYSYDGAGRFSYAKEENKGGKLNTSFQYCYDLAGNLTSQGTDQGCPGGTTYTYNDAQELTAKSSTKGGWSYDPIGNETAADSNPDSTRTAEKWTDHSQLSSLTVNGKTYAGQYGSTDQSERIALGDTVFHNGPLGLSAKTTAGTDMGFNREPGGTLNSMTTGGKTYYYLTDALGSVVALADIDGNKVDSYTYSPRGVRILAQSTEPVAQPYRFAGNYQDPTGLYHLQARYYDANIGRFTQPDPSGQEQNPYLYAEGDPVNRIDPNGLLSLGDVFDAKDLYEAAQDAYNGDTKALWGDVAGAAAGLATDTACNFGLGLLDVPTAGAATVLGETGCTLASAAVGDAASNAVKG